MLKELEIQLVLDSIHNYANTYSPRVMYCLVERRVSTRIFDKDAKGNMINPAPGTCLDSALVERQDDRLFDFFLIAHNATVATAQPVLYSVHHNSTAFDKTYIE
jgi:hypothetical protein